MRAKADISKEKPTSAPKTGRETPAPTAGVEEGAKSWAETAAAEKKAMTNTTRFVFLVKNWRKKENGRLQAIGFLAGAAFCFACLGFLCYWYSHLDYWNCVELPVPVLHLLRWNCKFCGGSCETSSQTLSNSLLIDMSIWQCCFWFNFLPWNMFTH